jgi:septal ring factor EnvC (AmiA/AmiB activator)
MTRHQRLSSTISNIGKFNKRQEKKCLQQKKFNKSVKENSINSKMATIRRRISQSVIEKK